MAVAPPGSPPSAARQSMRLPTPAFIGEPSFVLPRSWAWTRTRIWGRMAVRARPFGGFCPGDLRGILDKQQIWMGISRSWDSACGARRPCDVNPFSWLLSYWLIRNACHPVEDLRPMTFVFPQFRWNKSSKSEHEHRQSWIAFYTYGAHLVHFNWKCRSTEHTQVW